MWAAKVFKTDTPIDDGDVARLERNDTRRTLGYHDSRNVWKTKGTCHQIELHGPIAWHRELKSKTLVRRSNIAECPLR